MRTWAVVLICILAGCTDNSKVPEDIIQKDKMQKILWDMVQADRFAIDFLPKPGDEGYNEPEVLKVYQKVFNVHGITRDEFLKSNAFYLNHPDISKDIYDSIAAQAERRRAEVYKPKSLADSTSKDSLKKTSVMDSTRKSRLDSIRSRLKNK